MIIESIAIQHSFQYAGLSYAILKGFSLWPASVPKVELRSQLDLDFLITEGSAIEARRLLEARGYCLHAMSGRSWEFKIYENSAYTLKHIYKPARQRTVELHIEADTAAIGALQVRSGRISFHGVSMPVLSRVDLFLEQGLHLYKHVCSEFFRVAHLLEFRRHIVTRYHDDAFWQELRELIKHNPKQCLELGLVTLLTSHVMGDFAPDALTCWTVERLPASIGMWVELYGHRVVLADFPGSKLYLLLQRELQRAGLPAKRSLREALIPRSLPPAITKAAPGETLLQLMRRHYKQVRFIFLRLRFHTVEGLRYLGESIRWLQYSNQPIRLPRTPSRCDSTDEIVLRSD